MKNLIISTVLSTIALQAIATEVTVTGYGSSYEDSLQNAKIQAIEKVTGTWINSEHTLNNGKFDESIVQYNGGVIKSYEVISKSENSVTIKADVEKNKTNIVSGSSASIPESLRNELIISAEKNSQLEKAIQSLNDKNKAFSVKVNKIDYLNFGEYTQVTMNATLSWNPKWISDIETLSHTVDQKKSPSNNVRQSIAASGVTTSLAMFGPIGAIAGSILYSPVAGTEPKTSNESSICFGSTRNWTPKDCYIVNSPLTNFSFANTRFEIQGLSDKVKVIMSEGNIDKSVLYEYLYPGDHKNDIIGVRNTYNNPTVVLFKEESQNLTIQFKASTLQLTKVDKFNFVFK